MEIKDAIKKIVARKNLTEREAHDAFSRIMSGEALGAEIASFLTALRMKGETVDEITGAARALRERAVKINLPAGRIVIDTCGTGGSGLGVFNISTTAALVLASLGVTVAKHGNRASSGQCGSADVLEKLGVKIDISAEVTEKCIREIGIGFMFAPLYHAAMKHAAPVRKEIGIRTIFNLLGPLSNPAFVKRQVMGVYDGHLTETIAKVLLKLGSEKAYVVHSLDGLDDVTVSGKTKVSELSGGKVHTLYLTPASFGLKKSALGEIKCSSPEENYKAVKSVLSGEKGAKRDIVLMSSAMGLMVAEKVKNFKEGISIATEAIDSGRASKKLEELVRFTNDTH